MTPTTYSDVNGEYTGMDHKVHHVAAGQNVQYANFSGWDVYRSQFQLLTWLDPKRGSDIAQSLYNQSQQDHGRWDRWTHLSGATHVMNGDPAAPAVADIYAFGGRDFEPSAPCSRWCAPPTSRPKRTSATMAARWSASANAPASISGSSSTTSPWALPHGGRLPTRSRMSRPSSASLRWPAASARPPSQHRFLARAQYWKNIWNPNAAPDGGYFMNRNADGTWPKVQDDNDKAPHDFTPATEDGFVEGSAAQYVWMVPFNVAGLFEQMGGHDKAVARLDRFFYDDKGAPAVTKSGPLHAELDNEPSIETPWLYDFAGQPWKTQQLVRQVLNTIWKNAPNGIPGNDDLGEMSSWAVFAMMGFYPEIPGRAEFVLGSPIFTSVTVHRGNGDVHVIARAAATNAPYVQSLKLNGKPSTRTWLPESFALHGGTLEFELGPTPNKSWGTNPGDEPPSFGPQ